MVSATQDAPHCAVTLLTLQLHSALWSRAAGSHRPAAGHPCISGHSGARWGGVAVVWKSVACCWKEGGEKGAWVWQQVCRGQDSTCDGVRSPRSKCGRQESLSPSQLSPSCRSGTARLPDPSGQPAHVSWVSQCNEGGRVMSFSGADMFPAHVQSAACSSTAGVTGPHARMKPPQPGSQVSARSRAPVSVC